MPERMRPRNTICRAARAAPVSVIAIIATLLAACGSKAGLGDSQAPAAKPADARPACDAISTECHAHDDHGGLPRECHLFGHNPASTNHACEARKAACLAACAGAAK